MKATKTVGIILLLAMLAALVLGTACGSAGGSDGAIEQQGPQGPQGEQGEQGLPGPNMIVAMGMVNADGSLGQDYNVDSVSWDAANSRYVIKLTGITYTHTGFVTLVTGVDANYTATYAANNGNLTVCFRNTAGTKQQDHFSFVVLEVS
jgi:hypothetical protein